MSARTLSLDDALKLPRRALTSLIPSYLQRRSNATEDKPRRAHRTSALDGLRGVAALFVFFFHILFSYQGFVEYGYGQSDDQRRLIQLPFISLLYRGHSMVAIFFVVGGYVLSLKPLTLIHSHQQSVAHYALVSSVFRRGIRLYIPALVATFITMLTVYLGMWEYPRQFITEDQKYINYADMHPGPKATFQEQLWDWIHATIGLTNMFTYYNKDGFMLPYYNDYDPHLWTVPFEYRSSLIVTMVLLAFSHCKTSARLLLTLGTVVFSGMWDRWELVCFLSGTFLCDLDLTTRSTTSTDSDSESDLEHDEKLPEYEPMTMSSQDRVRKFFVQASRYITTILSQRWIVLFIAGLYLLSTPNFQIENTPGYRWLFAFTPRTYTDKKRFLQSVGAMLVTWSVANCTALQRPFDTRFAQYLGKISYALYIVHGPLIHVVGYSITPNIWIWITRMDGWRYWAGLFLASSVLAACVAVAADWFWRVVDTRAVRLSRWFERICFVKG